MNVVESVLSVTVNGDELTTNVTFGKFREKCGLVLLSKTNFSLSSSFIEVDSQTADIQVILTVSLDVRTNSSGSHIIHNLFRISVSRCIRVSADRRVNAINKSADGVAECTVSICLSVEHELTVRSQLLDLLATTKGYVLNEQHHLVVVVVNRPEEIVNTTSEVDRRQMRLVSRNTDVESSGRIYR